MSKSQVSQVGQLVFIEHFFCLSERQHLFWAVHSAHDTHFCLLDLMVLGKAFALKPKL